VHRVHLGLWQLCAIQIYILLIYCISCGHAKPRHQSDLEVKNLHFHQAEAV